MTSVWGWNEDSSGLSVGMKRGRRRRRRRRRKGVFG